VRVKVGVDLALAKPEDVGAEAEAGNLAGAPAAKHARHREPEEVGDLAGGQQRFGVRSDPGSSLSRLEKNRSISAYVDGIK
jgi:hypothetical protein